jgi:ABC-type spermidine/putrescine transport system permease subunit II
MSPAVTESVTWIKVEKPVFDLVGVVLSSLGLAFICAAISLALGLALGAWFVARRRRQARSWSEEISLHLGDPDTPAA